MLFAICLVKSLDLCSRHTGAREPFRRSKLFALASPTKFLIDRFGVSLLVPLPKGVSLLCLGLLC